LAYTQVGIVNLALGRLGVKVITTITEVTPQAQAANRVWEYIRDEVLEAKEWRFAKTRDKLARAPVSPMYTYDYAYVLPNDFLRLPKGKDPVEDPAFYPISVLDYKFETLQLPEGLEKITNGTFTGASTGWTLGTGWTYASNQVGKVAGAVNTLSQIVGSMVSVPVVGESYQVSFDVVAISGGALMPQFGGSYGSPVSDARVHTQIIEATSATSGFILTPMDPDVVCTIDLVSSFKVADRLCILTDYEDDEDNPVYMTYIKKVTDVTKYPPSFIDALAWRLAKELSINLPESPVKFNFCQNQYELSLLRAEEATQSMDYVETSSDDWEMAGR
jgi:hypothetical protein